jgi:uncharacterized membrane protein (UPF0182 family)
MKRSRVILVVAIALICACLGLPLFTRILSAIYTDWLWFDSLGYLSIYRTRLTAEFVMFLVGGLVAAAFVGVNWILLPMRATRRLEFVIRPSRWNIRLRSRALVILLLVVVGLVALMMAFRASSYAMDYLMLRNAVAFGQQDPIFELDAGFYIFRLPFYSALIGWAIALVVVTSIGAALLYLSSSAFGEKGVTAHLSVLAALFLSLLAVQYQISRLSLLDSARGLIFGAGYTDVHARLPLYQVMTALMALGALACLANLALRRWRLIVIPLAAWLVVAVVLMPIYPGAVQRFVVDPNELAAEWPYIEYNIAFTREAFGLEDVQEFDFQAEGVLTEDVLENNASTIDNIRLWDWRPLKTTYEQIQEIRLYYTFYDVDVDRYVIDDDLRQVTLAARELDVNQLADQAQTWINRHLIFTHGYGACLSPVNEITAEGLPNLLLRDIPPQTSAPALEITQPGIYFGELTHNYVIVGTTEQELDRPSGDQNLYTTYSGPDGVPLGGFFRRLLFALLFGDQQILFSDSLSRESRILFHRELSDRTETLAPMFWYDPDPYLVIADGRLVWLYDAYTYTDRYPYSEPFWADDDQDGRRDDTDLGWVNYIRNSVKVAIDAYTGETTYYVVDPDDPIVATYQAVFPDLFTPVSEMDPTLRDHWRYPELLFHIQAQAYAAYHMEDPQVFYNKEDLWDAPRELTGSGATGEEMTPYYVVMRLPGEDEAEFIMMRPYVPSGRRNMIAWLYVDSDGEDYGQMGVFKFSKEGLLYGPEQVEARFDQDAYISQQLTLWNQQGSEVVRGNLIVIPIDDIILYVEPLYLQAQSGGLPELKRVLLAYGNQVVMADDLSTALAQVLVGGGDDVPVGEEPLPTDVASLALSAQAHYRAAQDCLQLGDWACYGRELEALEADLEALIAATEEFEP